MLLAIALLMGVLSPQQGDVSVRGDLSPRTAAVGQTVVLSVTVRSKSAEDPLVTMPQLPSGLQVAGTSSSTSIEISMPGGRTNVVTQELEIVATREGSFTILPATVQLGGKTYRTAQFGLTISGHAPAGGMPGVLPQDVDAPIQLRASIDPKSPYIGQQVTLRLDAWMPADARYQTLRPPSYDPPALGGFWIQDFPDAISNEIRVVNGVPTQVQSFQRAYFPLSAGTFMMPPAHLIYDVRGGVFFAPETREATSDSMPIVVRPLPEAGKPASFTGAVGSFKVAMGVDRSTLSAGDALTYTLFVEGTGNMKALPPPVFPTLPDVDVYTPSEDATLKVVNAVVGGTRTFQWTLIPRKSGTLEIPAIEYSWFNPVTEKYESAKGAPIRINVTPAVSLATAGGDTTLSPLRTTRSSRIGAFPLTRTFLLLQLLPLLALLGFLTARRSAMSVGAQARAQRVRMDRLLAEMDTLVATDPRAFYADAIRIVDDAAAFNPAIRSQAESLNSKLRACLYAPEVPDEQQRKDDARRVREIVSAALTSTSHTKTSAIIAVLVALAIPVTLHARQKSAFEAGVEHFDAHDYRQAIQAFGVAVRNAPHDASAWFDLGNAYYRASDPGRAGWAWLHTLELQPRARDATHNLGILNARRALSETEHWFPVSDAELALLAAICWWVLIAITLVHLRRPSNARRIAAILAGMACSGALIMLAIRALGPTVVVPAAHGTPMYASPTKRTDTTDRFEVGDAAEIMKREGDWVLIRTSSFVQGWVPASDVLTL